MESIEDIRKLYQFTANDEKNLADLGSVLLPFADNLAEDFYTYLKEHPATASYFKTEEAAKRRKETLKIWFADLFNGKYDQSYLLRLERIGKVHVKIGLKSYYVNAAMNFIRDYCQRYVEAKIADGELNENHLLTLHKALDINLGVITSSFVEEEINKEFFSHRVDTKLIQWSERLLHGLNLILMFGLLAMAVGMVSLFVSDVIFALTKNLEHGVIKALGSLLILWMMIELLHAEIQHLRGGRFHVRIFLELALVAFIRKLFIATLEHKAPIDIAVLLSGLLVLGIVFFFIARVDKEKQD